MEIGYMKKNKYGRGMQFVWNMLIFLGIFAGAVLICSFYRKSEGMAAYASPVFVLAVLLVSRFTRGYGYGVAASLLGVICVNFFFTYPYLEVNFSIAGYPITFLTLLIVSLITGTLTTRAKQRDLLQSENEREKIRSDLLRSVSHDIRTPLTSIIGSTSAVLENEEMSREEARELLSDVNQEAQWLLRMVENLLLITKIDREQEIKKEPWAAEEIIGEVSEKLQKAYPGIRLEIMVPRTPLCVSMDPILIEQVLFNLAENSVIHGETADTIWISAAEKTDAAGSRAIFSVRDNGKGMPDELLQDFQKGVLRPEIGADGSGKRNMGLGLRVCSAIIRAHHGTMDLHSDLTGTEVTFSLPLT